MEAHDPLVAKIEVVLEHRRMLLDVRTLVLHHAQGTLSCEYRLSWLLRLVDQDRAARREIRQLERDLDRLLDEHGTTLRDESGIGSIAAAILIAEFGDPFRFARESEFARWCVTGAVALSSGEGTGLPVKHHLDTVMLDSLRAVVD